MVTSTMSALPEHWTELNASRENRRLCAEDVESIKKKWEAEGDSSKPVVQSPEHLGQILNRMLQRYQDSSDREWFSERRAVVLGLETMFSEAKEGRVSLKEIEASIGSEKEAWYRWVLRKYPEFLAVAGPGVDQEDVRSILDDPDRSREELVAVVGQAVGMSADWSERVDAFAEKVVAAKGDSAELKKLYISEFFKNPSTGETLQDAQEYLDMYEADRDMGLEAIIDKIIAANRADRNSQAQRGAHQRRLDELRRAKTAFEQNNVRSKSQKENPQANLVDEAYYNLPPCSVCKKDVDPSRVIACPICQMILHMGGQKALTVYCSEGCYEKGFDEHMGQEHDCTAGDACAQLVDEDVAMEGDSAGPMACNECLDHKQMTLFCSRRCAELNLASHRKDKHGMDTSADQVHSLVSPVEQLSSMILTEAKTGLKFSA